MKLYKEQSKLGFARGYHVEFGSGKGTPGAYAPFTPDTDGRTSFRDQG